MVLQTYGAGNLPGNRADIMRELKAATDRGVIVFNCSQCFKGSVNAVYQTGNVRISVVQSIAITYNPKTRIRLVFVRKFQFHCFFLTHGQKMKNEKKNRC